MAEASSPGPESASAAISIESLPRVVAEIPAETAKAEIRFKGQALWSRSAPGSAPRLEQLAPAGGEAVAPGEELRVRWLSVDVDGDDLTRTIPYCLFLGLAAPASPGPGACDPDPTTDPLRRCECPTGS